MYLCFLYSEMVPSYSTGVFKIHPYTCLKQQGDEVYSKPLHVCGTVWKLKVYPVGVPTHVHVRQIITFCILFHRMVTMKTLVYI